MSGRHTRTDRKTVIGFAFGGMAIEHDLSVKSALYVMAHLDRSAYDCVPLYVGPDGRFAVAASAAAKIREVIDHGRVPIFSPSDPVPSDFRDWVLGAIPEDHGVPVAAELLSSGALDIVFPLFHGQAGEDSIFQGLLEFLQVPYVGCGITGSAIGNDKELNKRICADHGLRVAEFRSARSDDWSSNADVFIREIERSFGYPVFVKPPCLGSSMGITKAYDRGALTRAIDLALSFGGKVLVERPVPGDEYGVAIIGNTRLEYGAVVEFGRGPDFLDYDAKYGAHAVEDTIPAVLSAVDEVKLQEAARTAYRALELSGMSRIDFFLSDGEVVFNEANTVPGFGKNSVFSKMWQAKGVGLSELIDRLVGYGFDRAEARRGLAYAPAGEEKRV